MLIHTLVNLSNRLKFHDQHPHLTALDEFRLQILVATVLQYYQLKQGATQVGGNSGLADCWLPLFSIGTQRKQGESWHCLVVSAYMRLCQHVLIPRMTQNIVELTSRFGALLRTAGCKDVILNEPSPLLQVSPLFPPVGVSLLLHSILRFN